MATVALSTAGRLEVIEPGEQETLIANVAITAGWGVQQNSSGRWIVALADTAPHSAGTRIALRTVAAGEPLTAMKSGVIGGFTVSQAFDAPLYLSDTGTIADAAGTVSVAIGRVVPGTANQAGDAHDKNIRIDCPL